MTDNDRELRQMRLYVRPHKRLVRPKLPRKGRRPFWGKHQRFNNYLSRTMHVRYPDLEKLIERLCE